MTVNWAGLWSAIWNKHGIGERNSPSFFTQGFAVLPTILASAETLAKADRALEAFDWLMRWLRDVLLLAVGAGSDHVLNLDQRTDMQALADGLDIDELLDLISDLEKLERQANRNLNLRNGARNHLVAGTSPAHSAVRNRHVTIGCKSG